MKKKILALLLAVIMIGGVLASCGKKEAAGGASTDLRISLASTPETIDPHKNSSLDGANYLVHLYDPLIRYKRDADGVEPGAAASWDISEDGLTWTFKMREGAKWSDGEPVTANDFEYSFKRLVNPETAAPYAVDMGQFILNGLEIAEGNMAVDELGVKAIDEMTLEVKLQGPCLFFDELMAFPTFSPVRKDMIEEYEDRWAIDPKAYMSNGAFKLESFSNDEQLVLVPNTHYYDADTIVPTSITCLFLADDKTQLSSYKAGEIDFGEDIPIPEQKAMMETGEWTWQFQLGTYYISLNTQKAPFDDPNVRKAFSLAIDREYIADVVKEKAVIPAYGFVGIGYKDAEPGSEFREIGGDLVTRDYEVAKVEAVEALAAAGYATPDNPDGEPFPIVDYLHNVHQEHQQIAEAMQQMWADVLGVKVEIKSQEWNVFLDTRRKGGFEMARDGWISDYNDANSLLSLQVSSSGNNNSQYRNPEYDRLISEANQLNDPVERMGMLHEAENLMLHEDNVLAPLFYYSDGLLTRPGLKNIWVIPMGYKFFHYASMEPEAK